MGASMTRSNFTAPLPPGKSLIHATNSDADINKDYKADYPVVGDARLVLGQFLEEIKRQTGGQARPANRELTDEIAASRQEWLDQWLPRLTTDEVPLNPYRVIWEIMHTVNLDNTIVTHESGSPREQVSPFWEARAPRSFIGWGKSTQLGYSLGLAMGAKLAAPEKLVINFMGDTAFGMVGLDVETAVRENIPITTVVLNNSTMAIYADSRIPTAVARYNIKADGRQLRRHVPGHGRLGRTHNRPRPDCPRHAPGPGTQRGRRVRPAGVHNQGGRGIFQVPVHLAPFRSTNTHE